MILSVEGFGEVMDDGDSSAFHSMQEVEIALERQRQYAKPETQLIDADTGKVLCWKCEKPIPMDRMEKHPQAAFCVLCLDIIEQRRKLRREER